MKKKYFHVLPAMLLLLAILFSCRPDILVEQDARNQAETSHVFKTKISLRKVSRL